jgi:predicted PurR-regulated permease PerM
MGLISPVLWGAVMAVAAFMPIVGIGVVLLPTALILYLKGSGWQALATVFFYLILTFVVDYLFKPKFVGNQANLPPLLVLLSIIGGISLSGVMGIIYGPLAVTAFLTLTEMYVLDYQPYFDHRDEHGNQDSPDGEE